MTHEASDHAIGRERGIDLLVTELKQTLASPSDLGRSPLFLAYFHACLGLKGPPSNASLSAEVLGEVLNKIASDARRSLLEGALSEEQVESAGAVAAAGEILGLTREAQFQQRITMWEERLSAGSNAAKKIEDYRPALARESSPKRLRQRRAAIWLSKPRIDINPTRDEEELFKVLLAKLTSYLSESDRRDRIRARLGVGPFEPVNKSLHPTESVVGSVIGSNLGTSSNDQAAANAVEDSSLFEEPALTLIEDTSERFGTTGVRMAMRLIGICRAVITWLSDRCMGRWYWPVLLSAPFFLLLGDQFQPEDPRNSVPGFILLLLFIYCLIFMSLAIGRWLGLRPKYTRCALFFILPVALSVLTAQHHLNHWLDMRLARDVSKQTKTWKSLYLNDFSTDSACSAIGNGLDKEVRECSIYQGNLAFNVNSTGDTKATTSGEYGNIATAPLVTAAADNSTQIKSFYAETRFKISDYAEPFDLTKCGLVVAWRDRLNDSWLAVLHLKNQQSQNYASEVLVYKNQSKVPTFTYPGERIPSVGLASLWDRSGSKWVKLSVFSSEAESATKSFKALINDYGDSSAYELDFTNKGDGTAVPGEQATPSASPSSFSIISIGPGVVVPESSDVDCRFDYFKVLQP